MNDCAGVGSYHTQILKRISVQSNPLNDEMTWYTWHHCFTAHNIKPQKNMQMILLIKAQ